MINDKRLLLPSLVSQNHSNLVILDLGCGPRKFLDSAIGIDLIDFAAVDIVGDVLDVLQMLPPASVDQIYSSHFLEHVENPFLYVAAMTRVLKPGSQVDIIVPHFSNSYFYSDPTHRHFYGLYTLSYWCHEDMFRRRVPQYGSPLDLEVSAVRLLFRSPFRIRSAFRRLVQSLVNFHSSIQEFYEENMSGVISCYELHWILRKRT